MSETRASVFDRHRKKTLAIFLLFILVCLLVTAEIILRSFAGLGSPMLYYSDPAFGFRLQPNQKISRYGSSKIEINNLGLRAADHWDDNPEDKILFLGDSVTHGGNWISDEDLFTSVAVEGLTGFKSGNAGVPNWGVENVHGLVVEAGFRPANTYVTTLVENDFTRGLQTGQNKPWIWYESPRFALREAANYGWYRYIRNPGQFGDTGGQSEYELIDQAARKLKQQDELLSSNGDIHLILISPLLPQVLGQQGKCPMVQDALKRQSIDVVYLLDELQDFPASEEEKRGWFQDECHLTNSGHRVWGEIMGELLKQRLAPAESP